jgi:GNAT superfamily N-acetyltransferase
MADTIKHVPFTPDLLDLVKDFDCGSEPYQMELADWIRNDALQAVEGGTLVWLYITQTGDVVGYGSLGESNWRYPDYQAKKRSKVLIIPAVALDKAYHGKPEGADRDARFSSQVMRHLIAEAQRWPTPMPALCLFVHPDNEGAIKLYTRFDFQPYPHTYRDREKNVTYQGYARPLP